MHHHSHGAHPHVRHPTFYGGTFGPNLGGGVSQSSAEKIRQLLAQRERLQGEICNEERFEAAELLSGKARIAAAESEEKQYLEASTEEQSRHKLVEEKLALSEGASSSLVSAASAVAMEGYGVSPAALSEEIQIARERLDSARNARSTLASAKAASERQRLDEWIGAIRTGSQENQAMEANQQMAQAHLKALEAMAASSSSQVRVRESALHGMLCQLEDHESATLEARRREQAVERQLEAASAEIQRHEAIVAPSSWASEQVTEDGELRSATDMLRNEVESLREDCAVEQERLDSSRRLQSSLDDLRRACEAATRLSQESVCRPPLLESEVARLTIELHGEQRAVIDLEEKNESIREASYRLRNGVDATVATLNTELAKEKDDAAAVAQLESELEALTSEFGGCEAECQQRHVEAAERDKQFLTITQNLQEQIAQLKTEFIEEESAMRATKERRSPASSRQPSMQPSTAIFPPVASNGGGGTGGGMSVPPRPLVDPGRGAEPPPRRSIRQDTGMGAGVGVANGVTRHNEDLVGLAFGASRGHVLGQSSNHRLGALASESMPHANSLGSNVITSAHRPYWRELERGWHPSGGISVHSPPVEDHLSRSVSPAPAARRPQALDTTVGMGIYNALGGPRPELGSGLAGSLLEGSSDASHLFHTRDVSESFDTHLFRTPLAGQAQRASPLATTLRRGASDARVPFFAEAMPGHHGADVWGRGGSPPPRARTPPARLPFEVMDQGASSLTRQASAGASFGFDRPRTASPPPPKQPPPLSVYQAEAMPDPRQTHPENGPDRQTAFQASLAELKGVIGASLRSLDQEEAADNQTQTEPPWLAARNAALANRAEAFRGPMPPSHR